MEIPHGAKALFFRSGHETVFAAGADMLEMSRFDAVDAEAFARAGQELLAVISRLPLARVVLIDGDCFGGAVDLALAFDVRFATRRSRFSHPGARIGIVTGFGGTSRWRGVFNRGIAGRVFLGNAILSADDMRRMQFVHRIVDDVSVNAGADDVRSLLIDAFGREGERRIAVAGELAGRTDGLPLSTIQLLARRLSAVRCE